MNYGAGESLQLDGPVEFARSIGSETAEMSHSGPGDLAKRALESPLDYPPLASCLAPGDHIALAVAEGLPAAGQVIGGLLAALESAGVAPERIVALCEAKSDQVRLEGDLAAWRDRGVRFQTHAPGDADQLCFAGVRHNDHELLLGRPLVEAEVAIPVTCSRAGEGRTARVFDGFYPAFADSASRQDGLNHKDDEPSGRFKTAADEAGWLLGVTLAVQVVPQVGGGVAAVYAGPSDAVSNAAAGLTDDLWTRRVATRSPLVIAAVAGDADQQTWTSVARAIQTAERVAEPEAAIALCTTLSEPLDEDLARRLVSMDEEDWLPTEDQSVTEDDRPTAEAAQLIAAARRRGPVYLMSRLDPDWVEDIGLAPVANERELSRLIARRGGAVVIEDAQHVSVELSSVEAVL
ncbi:MAG: hypothetical protein AAGJ46_06710 [Planctomycetota bacterium]